MVKILEDSDSVVCPICGRSFSYINNFHLKSHGYTSEKEFLIDYPDTKLVSDNCSSNRQSHIMSLNTDSKLQSMKGKSGWNDERRKQKSDQMTSLAHELHTNDMYKGSREIMYKNRFGNPKKFTKNDGTVIKCRSKLEWDIALFLSQNKIEFEYESLQIKYISPKDDRVHQYIPDYYLKEYNLVIEGKYSNEKDLPTVLAKKKATEDIGYRFIFIDEILMTDKLEIINIINKP